MIDRKCQGEDERGEAFREEAMREQGGAKIEETEIQHEERDEGNQKKKSCGEREREPTNEERGTRRQ